MSVDIYTTLNDYHKPKALEVKVRKFRNKNEKITNNGGLTLNTSEESKQNASYHIIIAVELQEKSQITRNYTTQSSVDRYSQHWLPAQ